MGAMIQCRSSTRQESCSEFHEAMSARLRGRLTLSAGTARLEAEFLANWLQSLELSDPPTEKMLGLRLGAGCNLAPETNYSGATEIRA